MLCRYCRKIIPRTSIRKTSHENLAFSEDPLWFCSKKCYVRWLEEVSSDTVRTYYVWIVDEVLNNVKFIKKLIQVKGISREYGPSTEDTHFSEKL